MAKRILIVPAGSFQVPAIHAALARGLEVVALDADPNAPGLAIAHIAEPLNPTDPEILLDAARRHKVDAVVSIANDPSVVPCACVTDALGLPGLSLPVARRVRDKFLSLEALRAGNSPYCPRYHALDGPNDLERLPEICGLPLVLKPSSNNGSKGVIIVDDEQLLQPGYDYARSFAKNGPIIAEERLTGREFSVESITIKGRTTIVAITDKITTPPPYCAEIGHTIPADLSDLEKALIEHAVIELIETLGVDNSPAHTELFLTPQGPKFVELGARLGGGCIASDLVPLATGVDMVDAAIALALGEQPNLAPTRASAAAIRFFTPAPGKLTAIEGLNRARAVEGVVRVECLIVPGGTVHPLMNSDQRIGYVMAQGASHAEAAQRAELALATVTFITE